MPLEEMRFVSVSVAYRLQQRRWFDPSLPQIFRVFSSGVLIADNLVGKNVIVKRYWSYPQFSSQVTVAPYYVT